MELEITNELRGKEILPEGMQDEVMWDRSEGIGEIEESDMYCAFPLSCLLNEL